MCLWIRSQDKKALVQVNQSIKIINGTEIIKRIEDNHIYSSSQKKLALENIQEGYSMIIDDINLGTYSTEDRALEILDCINGLLEPMIIYKNDHDASLLRKAFAGEKIDSFNLEEEIDIKNLESYVYRMPKE